MTSSLWDLIREELDLILPLIHEVVVEFYKVWLNSKNDCQAERKCPRNLSPLNLSSHRIFYLHLQSQEHL